MDTITTGIGGALIGRALPQPKAGPVATLTVTAAALLPDADVFHQLFQNDALAGFTQHRGFTHSMLGVLVMAPLIALAVRLLGKDKQYVRLLLLATLGLVWHLFTDLATSWGTMVLHPFSRDRVVWDLLFIIDFIFTGILLLPHLAAWTYRDRPRALRRGALVWMALTLFTALMIQVASPFFGVPFRWSLLALLGGLLTGLLLLPALRSWGFRQSAGAFCRVGVAVLVLYLGVCTAGHFAALAQVNRFVQSRGLTVEAQGALPQPLSPFRWSGLVLTPEGVYQSWFSVFDSAEPYFEFFASADENQFITQAGALPEARTFLWFARFPVVRYRTEPNRHIVEYSDLRFRGPNNRTTSFVFRVVLNARGDVISWGVL